MTKKLENVVGSVVVDVKPTSDIPETGMYVTTETLNTLEVQVDYALNGREDPSSPDSSYNIGPLESQITSAGRIFTAIGVEAMPDGTRRVLDGFRRMTAARRLLANPNTSATLRKTLERMEFRVYHRLTDEARSYILFNHGSQSPLTRVETVKQAWRYSGKGLSPEQVYDTLYTVLLALSGKKEQERLTMALEQIGDDEKARKARLKKFFDGKIKDYFLDANNMTDQVRMSVIECESGRFKAGMEKDDVKLFKTNQPRIVELSAAKRRDQAKNGKSTKGDTYKDWDGLKDGLGWGPKKGGIRFDETIAKFLAEDKNGKSSKDGRMPKDQLEDRKSAALSEPIQLAFALAKGDPLPAGADLLEMDRNYAALGMIQKIALANMDSLQGKDSYPVLLAIALPDGNEQRFINALAQLIGKAPIIPEDDETPVAETPVAETAAVPDAEIPRHGRRQKQRN